MNAWLQRCLTCQYSIPHSRIEDTECTAKLCKYSPKLAKSNVSLTYTCIRCTTKFTDQTKYPTSFMGFGNDKYCRTCLLDIIDACNEIKEFKSSFEDCERR